MYCIVCKGDVGLTVGRTRYRKNGIKTIDYICRSCNATKKRAERKRNPAADNRATAKYRSKFKEKHNARLAARKNIPLKPCQVCGSTQSVRHHEDHSKPLEVKFLCHLHHKQVHLGVISCLK